ncbi:sugar phosphate isomerase/epimerase family protein [Paenibacillus sp. GP183]|uniref:sugar phosphate isomerase/epimerase family protein n=1 Tax=Paenibacillus sp. GP183 TaxID=1882751 RepID=UPI00089BC8D1|nr:sugar phosphate isomerase/epimerase family protein [Paenibacillus sp. GP183]SEC61792.1 Sugar phosphate isomerase/epimerase [Paenibacillus sp. GP183]
MKPAFKTSLSVWSCHKYFFDKVWTNADFIHFAGQQTLVDGVELLHKFWNPVIDIPQIEKALQQEGLEVACVGASNNFALPNTADRDTQLQQVIDSINIADLYGAKVVRVFSGSLQEGVSFEQGQRWIIEGLKAAAEYAGKKDITLCLENHGLFAGKAGQVQKIIREVNSPALRSTFDTGNFILVDENPNDALEQLNTMIAHVHCKDFIKVEEIFQGETYVSLSGVRYAGTVIGEGSVPLDSLLARLHELGYDGWLTVEFEGNEEQKSGSIRSVANLTSMLEKL